MTRIILAFALLRAKVFALPIPESDNPAVSGRGPASRGSGLIEESLTWPERAPLLDLEPDEANSTRVYILLDVFKAESPAPRQANSSDEVGDYYFDNAEL